MRIKLVIFLYYWGMGCYSRIAGDVRYFTLGDGIWRFFYASAVGFFGEVNFLKMYDELWLLCCFLKRGLAQTDVLVLSVYFCSRFGPRFLSK